MDSRICKRREVFFRNMLLLGLDTSNMKKKYNIEFHKDIFCVPNKKAYEIVTNFLFVKLNKVSNTDFSILWPLFDKEQERQFRKTCFNHLLNISQSSNTSIRFPRIVQSIFSSPGGDRFYVLYLAFSSYVLEQHIKKTGNAHLIRRGSLNQQNFQSAMETVQLSTIITTKDFKDTQAESLKHRFKWITCAKDYLLCYRNIKKSITSKESLLKEKKTLLSSLYSKFEGSLAQLDLQAIISKIGARSKMVKEQWKLLEDYLLDENKLWDFVCSELEENSIKYCLESSNYTSLPPEILLRECGDELQIISQELDNDVQFSVVSFIKLLTICLEYYINTVKKAGTPQSHLLLAEEKNIASIGETLHFIKSLSEKLAAETIPNTEIKNQVLKQELFSDQIFGNSESICSKFPPLTPKLNFSPESIQSRYVICNSGRLLLSPLPDQNDTDLFCTIIDEAEDKIETCNTECPNLWEIDSDECFIEQQNLNDCITPVDYSACQNTDFLNTSKLSTIDESVEEEKSVQCVPNVPLNKEMLSFLDDNTLDDFLFACPSTSYKPYERKRHTRFKMRESWLKEDNLVSLNLSPGSFENVFEED